MLQKVNLILCNLCSQMTKMVRKVLSKTKFSSAPIVSLSAKDQVSDFCPGEANKAGLSELVQVLSQEMKMPTRNSQGPFLMATDHCFLIRGQGTVLTGTVIQGTVKVNQV